MRKTTYFLIVLALGALLAGCSGTDNPTSPDGGDKLTTALVRGEFNDGTFDYEFESESPGGADDPAAGSFRVRIRNMAYDTGAGVLQFDMWLINASPESYREPVRLTFMQLMPDSVSVLNADNGETGGGALFNFAFADSDSIWSPDEVTTVRQVQFRLEPNTSVSFVSKVEIGDDSADTGGTIGGMVWHDLNGDGMMDPGERGAPGVGIMLNAGARADSTMMMMRAFTDSAGRYAFAALDAGHYTVMIRRDRDRVVTTAPELHVLLVDFNGEVADFLTADFGVMYDEMSDSLVVGCCVNAKGDFMTEPDRLESEIFNYGVCDSTGYRDDDHDDGGHMGGDDDDDHPGDYGECWGRLSGPITDLDLENSAVQVMGTWVSFPDWERPWTPTINGEDRDLELGMRVRIKARIEATDKGDQVVACSIHFWNGNGDRVRGVVQEILRNDDDVIIGVKVLNTLVTMPQ